MSPGRHARVFPERELRCRWARLSCFAEAVCSPAELRLPLSQSGPGRASASQTVAFWRRVPQETWRPNQPGDRAVEERPCDRRLPRWRDPGARRFPRGPSRGVRAPRQSTRRRPRRCRGWAHPSRDRFVPPVESYGTPFEDRGSVSACSRATMSRTSTAARCPPNALAGPQGVIAAAVCVSHK